jgi:hypothetical protein
MGFAPSCFLLLLHILREEFTEMGICSRTFLRKRCWKNNNLDGKTGVSCTFCEWGGINFMTDS